VAAAKATKKEDPLISICGECVELLRGLGNTKAAIQLEKAGQDLIREHNVEILCAYRSSGFDENDTQALSSICAGHTTIHFK